MQTEQPTQRHGVLRAERHHHPPALYRMDAGAGAAADDGFSYGYLLDARGAGLAAVVAETDDARATRSLLRRWPRRLASPPPYVRRP